MANLVNLAKNGEFGETSEKDEFGETSEGGEYGEFGENGEVGETIDGGETGEFGENGCKLRKLVKKVFHWIGMAPSKMQVYFDHFCTFPADLQQC